MDVCLKSGLAEIGRIDEDGIDDQRLTAIEGQPPDLASLPPGCAFAPRCPRAVDQCLEAPPPEFFPEEGRTSRCWLTEPVGMRPIAARSDRRVPTGAGARGVGR